tara:strand:+ start:4052 stop:4480 length:429 start_codon:yes stop_codon:yes gene_type:complete
MNKKSIYILFVFVVIPVYLFYETITLYFKNMGKITYSLEIPVSRDINTEKIVYDIQQIPNIKEKKSLRRSWVLLIQSNDKSQISYLIDKLGLKDTIKVKSEIDNIQRDAIGPFLDKQIALDLQTKIKKITSLNITIQEIVEK